MAVLSKPAATAGVAALAGLIGLRLYMRRSERDADDQNNVAARAAANTAKKAKGSGRRKVAVDMVFLRRIARLIKILVPGPFTPEVGYIILVAVMMLTRTYCDLWMIQHTTKIERIIISRNADTFYSSLFWFFLGLIPIAFVNNLLKYGLWAMATNFRKRLTLHLYGKYLKGFTYYKISNLDNRVQNADQLLTQDVERFSQSLADLYSNLSKPILDIIIYARKLSGAIGYQGPSMMLGYLAFSGVFLTWLRRPTGKFTVLEQRLEGEFRFVNSRLITNAEEIAFYKGNRKEEGVLRASFDRLLTLVRKAHQFRFSMGVVDTLIAKYLATIVGFYVVSRPFLDLAHPRHLNSGQDEIMQDYYKSGRMLMNLAGAVGRLVLAGRELTRLAGFTARVTELMDVLDDLNNGKYTRTMVTMPEGSKKLVPNSGKLVEVDHLIQFTDVPLVTPNGDVLIDKLNFTVQSGMNVLVCGPNGCGKSSLFRVLGELWPLFGGTLHKPAKEKLFYVPQRPYMTLGTLRDQIIYPHSAADMKAAGYTDADLERFLDHVHLRYLVEREGGWDAVEDWMDVLSGGEKQRVAMSRLFYHKPQFAILDECTSAVSVDVEGFMYAHCRELGITLFTVSHRKSLWKYHEFVLAFDGRGKYTYEEIKEGTEQFGS
mmetsp:Transcript_18610/g.71801  ORF Transcript_18610/g.71801 Transcript_18610/m.71801 type:complete len:656 (-) Transcript_18610:60-2027(-)